MTDVTEFWLSDAALVVVRILTKLFFTCLKDFVTVLITEREHCFYPTQPLNTSLLVIMPYILLKRNGDNENTEICIPGLLM